MRIRIVDDVSLSKKGDKRDSDGSMRLATPSIFKRTSRRMKRRDFRATLGFILRFNVGERSPNTRCNISLLRQRASHVRSSLYVTFVKKRYGRNLHDNRFFIDRGARSFFFVLLIFERKFLREIFATENLKFDDFFFHAMYIYFDYIFQRNIRYSIKEYVLYVIIES